MLSHGADVDYSYFFAIYDGSLSHTGPLPSQSSPTNRNESVSLANFVYIFAICFALKVVNPKRSSKSKGLISSKL